MKATFFAACALVSALLASSCSFDSSQLRALGPDGGLGGAGKQGGTDASVVGAGGNGGASAAGVGGGGTGGTGGQTATATSTAPATCVPGASVACACSNGEQGAQTCTSAGTFAACVCAVTMPDAGRAGGSGGAVALDAGSAGGATVLVDGGIDVPYSPDVSPPVDRGTGGSTVGGSGGSSAAGSGGMAGQGGSTTVGGSAVPDAAVTGSGGGGRGGASSSGGAGGAGATGGSGGGGATATGGAITTCTPVPKSTGGISCPGGFCTVGAYSGEDFSFADPTGKSSVCVTAGSLCGAGTVGAQNPPSYTVWGAGFGFSLSPSTTLAADVPVQLTGTSMKVTVSSLPTGADMRLQVKHYVGATPTTYCAVMTTATQTIPWTSFNTMCWTPASGVALTGPPNTSNIQFQASSRATAGSFDFCVTALSFQ